MLANGTPMFVRRRRVPATPSAATTTPTTRTTRPPGSTGIGSSATADVFRFFQRDDRVPQGAPVDRAQPLLARRRALVRRRRRTSTCRSSRTRWPTACTAPRERDDDLYVMINAYWEPLEFTIQEGAPGPAGGASSTPRYRHPTTSRPREASRSSAASNTRPVRDQSSSWSASRNAFLTKPQPERSAEGFALR